MHPMARAESDSCLVLTPVETPSQAPNGETIKAPTDDGARSPKRRNSSSGNVLEKVKSKLGRSLTLGSSFKENVPSADDLDKRPAVAATNGHHAAPAPIAPSHLKVTLRSRKTAPAPDGLLLSSSLPSRRCKSEIHSPSTSTAELLAQFVATRNGFRGGGSMEEAADGDTPPELPPKTTAVRPLSMLHSPLPPKHASSSETQPILSVDRETGIIAVDQMWTCSKCSYAYNRNAADRCDICTTTRSPRKRRKQNGGGGGGAGYRRHTTTLPAGDSNSLDADFQMVTNDLLPARGCNNGNGDDDTTGGSGEEETWVCKRCTLENPSDSGSCLACSASKAECGAAKVKKKSGGGGASGWTCPKCTLKNVAEAAKCSACDADRPAARKKKKVK